MSHSQKRSCRHRKAGRAGLGRHRSVLYSTDASTGPGSTKQGSVLLLLPAEHVAHQQKVRGHDAERADAVNNHNHTICFTKSLCMRVEASCGKAKLP